MNWLKERREALGLSQEELTARLQIEGVNVTRGSLSNWETERHKPPLDDPQFRIALSNALKMSVKEIMKRSGYDITLKHSEAAERGAFLIDQMDAQTQGKAVKILEALL